MPSFQKACQYAAAYHPGNTLTTHFLDVISQAQVAIPGGLFNGTKVLGPAKAYYLLIRELGSAPILGALTLK